MTVGGYELNSSAFSFISCSIPQFNPFKKSTIFQGILTFSLEILIYTHYVYFYILFVCEWGHSKAEEAAATQGQVGVDDSPVLGGPHRQGRIETGPV